MSIASAILAKQQQIADSYTAVSNKGGTLPATQNLNNLPTAINSIPSGNIIGVPREISSGVYQMPTSSFTFNLPSNVTDVGYQGLQYVLSSSLGLTSVDLSNLTTLSGGHALSAAFSFCNNLASVNFSNLATISGSEALLHTFNSCISLTSVTFPSLASINADRAIVSAFANCTFLTSISFPALTSTSFGTYTNQFDDMLSGVTGCTVHFPSNLQSVIGSWTSVSAGFSGTNTTVLFDLTATE